MGYYRTMILLRMITNASMYQTEKEKYRKSDLICSIVDPCHPNAQRCSSHLHLSLPRKGTKLANITFLELTLFLSMHFVNTMYLREESIALLP